MRALSHATDELRKFNERTAQENTRKNARENAKEKVRRDPAGNYIAIAFNTTTVTTWLRQHGIDPRRMRIITSMRDARGVGYDLIAICFPDWGERNDREFHQAVKLLEQRIIAYRYSDQDRPVVEKGKIIGWVNIHQPTQNTFTRPAPKE